MRITGGMLKGRKLPVPKGGVRPTQERVREALFSSIAAGVSDATVLDLYAGTGALGLEAWSRGAASVFWVESDPRAFRMMRQSIAELCGVDVARGCVQADVLHYLRMRSSPACDFILADPPYGRHDSAFDMNRFLTAVAESGCLKSEGLLVFEQRSKQSVCEHPRWHIVRERSYGEARLIFYKPILM